MGERRVYTCVCVTNVMYLRSTRNTSPVGKDLCVHGDLKQLVHEALSYECMRS